MAEPPEDCLTGLEHIREVFGLDTCGTTEFKFEPRSTIMMPAAPQSQRKRKKREDGDDLVWPSCARITRPKTISSSSCEVWLTLCMSACSAVLPVIRIPRPVFSRSLPITSFKPNIMILMIPSAALASVVLRQLNSKPRYPNREGRRVIAQDLVDQRIEELATLNNVTKIEMKKWHLKGMIPLWEELGYVASKKTQSPPTVKSPFLSVPGLFRILHRKMNKRERIGRSEDQVTPSIRRCFGSYCTVRLFPVTRRSRLWRMRNGGMC
jgi:hypothetical protein